MKICLRQSINLLNLMKGGAKMDNRSNVVLIIIINHPMARTADWNSKKEL